MKNDKPQRYILLKLYYYNKYKQITFVIRYTIYDSLTILQLENYQLYD